MLRSRGFGVRADGEASVVPRARALDDPPAAGLQRETLLANHPFAAQLVEQFAGGRTVVAAACLWAEPCRAEAIEDLQAIAERHRELLVAKAARHMGGTLANPTRIWAPGLVAGLLIEAAGYTDLDVEWTPRA